MTKQVQRRRGTDSQHTSFTGANGELSVNTTNKSVHVHDGVTAGGVEAARADLDNVLPADIASGLSGGTVASLTITSADINGGNIDGTSIGGSTPAAGTFSSISTGGNITVAGTVDGRDVAADGTKLDGIEAGATADQTAAEIKAAYEINADTNVFDDAAVSKLAGIEAGATADQTGSEIATAISGETVGSLTITSADINGGTIDATNIGVTTAGSGSFTTLNTTGAAVIGGDLTVNGTTTTINSTTLTVDDLNIVLASGAADAAAANGAGITIDGASATLTYDSTADAWQVNKDFDVTGAITVTGTVDGRDIASDGSKLDGIEVNATADQTGAEIASAISGETVATLTISSATISGGSVSGITDLAVADGGTGASTAEGARTNLNVDPAGTAVALAIALG
jgi:hypothetical protein